MTADLASVYFGCSVYLRARLERLTFVTWEDEMVWELIEAIAPDDTWKQSAYQAALEYRLKIGRAIEPGHRRKDTNDRRL